MPKKFYLILFFIAGLVLFAGCQTLPGFNIFKSGQEQNQAAPHSYFIGARQVLKAEVGQPVAIETYHLGTTKLATVTITIDDQPASGEINPFPKNLATAQVLVWGQPPQVSLQQLTFPAPACHHLSVTGGPVRTSALSLQPPSSIWTLCHVWTACTPGTYKLDMQAIDKNQVPGNSIEQWIEVMPSNQPLPKACTENVS